MSYFTILYVFIIPPILVLVFSLVGRVSRNAWRLLFILVGVAVIYTTPWDNYLVASKVWWYDPELVTGWRIGWVPIEEYTFFVLQTLFTGMFYFQVTQKQPAAHRHLFPGIRWVSMGLAGFLWLGSVAILLVGWEPGTYLALILVWALIPVMIQLAFGADLLLSGWTRVSLAILIPTLYLAMVDWMAISYGTWTINPEKITGVTFAGLLPLEEALFFLMTNVLVVFGLHLGLHPESVPRLPKILQKPIGILE